MPAIGGSPETVSLDGREFTWTEDSDINRSLGGYTNTVLQNGDGSSRLITNRKGWRLEGGSIVIDNAKNDQEYIETLIASKRFFNVVVTYAGPVSYAGKGQIEGDANFANQTASMPITLAGTGQLKKL